MKINIGVPTNYNSRKWILTLLGIGINVTLLLVSKIDQATFANLFMFVFGSYSVANVMSKNKREITPPPADLPKE